MKNFIEDIQLVLYSVSVIGVCLGIVVLFGVLVVLFLNLIPPSSEARTHTTPQEIQMQACIKTND